MKCLSIQQPWTSLICGGIKDIENRSWRVNDAPGRILIHAGKTMRPMGELPTFFGVLIDNAIACGYVPEVDVNNLPEVYDFPKIKRDGIFELDDIVIEPMIDEDSGEPVLFYDPNSNELELYTVELMYQIILDKDLKL